MAHAWKPAALFVLIGAAACGGKLAAGGDPIPCTTDVDCEIEPPSVPAYSSSSTSSSGYTTSPGFPGYPTKPQPVPEPYPGPEPYPEPKPEPPPPPPKPTPYPIPIYDAGPPPLPPPLPPAPAPAGSWIRYPLDIDSTKTSACAGGLRYVSSTRNKYGFWVGLELCSATRYKIYLSTDIDAPAGYAPFYPVADSSGGGADHCELVNPNLKLANEDSFTGSNCPSCDNGFEWDHPVGALVYTRANLGEPFKLNKWPEYNLYTSTWYECGVSIP